MIEMLGFPLPPSENQLYRNVQGIGRVKAIAYRHYEKEFEIWRLRNRFSLQKAITALNGSYPLKIELLFKFNYARLYTKRKTIKRLDVSNRLKCFLDLLSKALQFDDSRFFEIKCEKCIAPEEGVNIKIFQTEVRNLSEDYQTTI